MNQVPAIGRIVHVIIEDKRNILVERPALIVRTWPGVKVGDVASYVNLQIFTDSDGVSNDGLPPVLWRTSVNHDPAGQRANTWHWPDEGNP